ncbi:hypothetical protein [Polyangium fumosum]|uniref:LysM domain-containing protein n=1 Tax=Polyangium fumosum TaxID=889272 RepID=A0A4U1IIR7_9BACT|nr:hypothetical protein [Polyangium fumosum]TKC93711.1 hypothetical protein E8A74_49045 [Polyangium fumosum]
MSYDTSGLDDEEHVANGEDTGDFLGTLMGGGAQLLSSLMGGGGKSGGNEGIGAALGSIAGAGLGTLAGGAGAGIGANLGKMAGGAVESLLRKPPKKKKKKPQKPPPKPATVARPAATPARRLRLPTKHERKLLVEAERMTERSGERGYLEEAHLRVFKPTEYKRRRDAGLLWSQNRNEEAPHDQSYEVAPPDDAQPVLGPEDHYDDTAAPDTRPQPLRHLSATPMTEVQLDALVRGVPLLRMVDPRILRLFSGSVGVARDVSGVDPTTGIYHAIPGETPHGITKKLTGQMDRTQELLAANPGKAESSMEWNIPPGWLQYARETGATFSTARKYVVVKDDWPEKIAKKLGAFPARAKWWSELKAANPHKPTQSGTGNWASLFPGEEIGIPNSWPEHALAIPIQPQPSRPETPGLPGPGKNVTIDPALVPQSQALLMRWAVAHPNDCTPSDFGRNPVDLVSGFTPRATQALGSFQAWWNKQHPTRALSSNPGELDKPTYDALVETNNTENPPLPWFGNQENPAPPNPPPQQQTSGGASQGQSSGGASQGQSSGGSTTPFPSLPAERPEWVPKEVPWPPQFPGWTQPQQSSGGTSQGQSSGGTSQGQSSSGGTSQGQSSPSGQSSGGSTTPFPSLPAERPEWVPKEVPWPPQFPGWTQPQQSSSGTSQGQSSPSGQSSGGSSTPFPSLPAERPEWVPKEVPWPPQFPGWTQPQQSSGGGSQGQSPSQGGTSQGGSSQVPGEHPPNAPAVDWGSAFDAQMPDSEKAKVLYVLAYAVDADEIQDMAEAYHDAGYPRAAEALHQRALLIRVAEREFPPPARPPSSGSGPEQQVDPSYTTQHASGEGDSLLPVLALVGAGLAFS